MSFPITAFLCRAFAAEPSLGKGFFFYFFFYDFGTSVSGSIVLGGSDTGTSRTAQPGEMCNGRLIQLFDGKGC